MLTWRYRKYKSTKQKFVELTESFLRTTIVSDSVNMKPPLSSACHLSIQRAETLPLLELTLPVLTYEVSLRSVGHRWPRSVRRTTPRRSTIFITILDGDLIIAEETATAAATGKPMRWRTGLEHREAVTCWRTRTNTALVSLFVRPSPFWRQPLASFPVAVRPWADQRCPAEWRWQFHFRVARHQKMCSSWRSAGCS